MECSYQVDPSSYVQPEARETLSNRVFFAVNYRSGAISITNELADGAAVYYGADGPLVRLGF
jgi:hypothetical protein